MTQPTDTLTLHEQTASGRTVLTIRRDGVVIQTCSGSDRENALLHLRERLGWYIEQGRCAQAILDFLAWEVTT